MKQKYVLQKAADSQKVILREYAELDKDILSFLCEEMYDIDSVRAAAATGKSALISALRTDNMYPPALYVSEIADRMIDLVSDGDSEPKEILFDDSDYIATDQPASPQEEKEVEEEDDGIENLLEEDIADDDYGDKKPIKDFKSSIKIAEHDSLDGEVDA